MTDIHEKWVALCLPVEALDNMIKAGKMSDKDELDWKKLLGILCGSIGKVKIGINLLRNSLAIS